MKITGFDGKLFTTFGVQAGLDDQQASARRRAIVQARRSRGPSTGGVEVAEKTLTAYVVVTSGQDFEDAMVRCFGGISPEDDALRPLTGTTNAGTAVAAQALVLGWRSTSSNTGEIDFAIPSGEWRYVLPRSSGPMTISANAAIALRNEGRKVARPTLDVTWRAGSGAPNRSSVTSLTGWKLIIPVTLTNNGDRTVANTAIQLGPFPTNALVTAGDMRSDGNDLRLYRNGKQIRRDLVAPNSPFTFIWFVPDPLAAGQSHTYDLVYGNASAGAPKTLSFSSDPQRPAFDITGVEVAFTSSTSNSVSQTGANWEVDQWAGATLLCTDGQRRKVLSNTATTITVTRAFSSAPSGADRVVLTKSGYKGDGGICTSATVNSLNDSTRSGISPSFGDNEWKGGTIEITSGTGAGQIRTILSNTQSNIIVSSNWTTTPDTTSRYRLVAKNRYLVYDVRQTDRNSSPARGLWSLNQGQSRPSQVRFDSPGSWYRYLYKRNGDSYSQPRAVGVNVGGSDVDYFSTLNIQRSREGKAGAQEEVGLADSVLFSSVFPLIGLRSYYLYRSAQLAGDPTKGMCRMLLGVQEGGGDEWDIVFDYGPAANSSIGVLGPFDFTPYGSPLRIMTALVPQLGDEIPDEDNNTAQLQSDPAFPYWAIDVDSSSLAVTDLSAPTSFAIYDLELLLRTGGGLTAAKPYKQIAIGGEAGKVFIRNNETVRIDCDNLTAEKLDVSLVKLASLGHLIRPADVVTNRYGQTKSLIPDDWLPVPFGENLLANPSFDTDAAGWVANVAGSAGVTATRGRVAALFFDTAGSFEINVTANTGAGGFASQQSDTFGGIVAGQTYLYAGWARREQTTSQPGVFIFWYTAAGVFVSVTAGVFIAPAINTWAPLAHSAVAPATAAQARVAIYQGNMGAGVLGKVQHDGLYFGLANSKAVLHVSDPSGTGWGTLELSYSMPEAGFW